ncbi:uncharacterized protein Ecym_2110 [Eremothecium cymbalariae DBVPG|uniref:Uncharacterized protein n=1 Tax=Eremothecium cymbalariae (strain CBS 270.75 / DBVPG 7215 / KCTC 17166 / NRRL Y-17582) TaxID=931890 RepID=G8JPL4_ERECY|nr:Hypothetical protein Ecym_2110 [Eremothecium cymbalariae DBVPG\
MGLQNRPVNAQIISAHGGDGGDGDVRDGDGGMGRCLGGCDELRRPLAGRKTVCDLSQYVHRRIGGRCVSKGSQDEREDRCYALGRGVGGGGDGHLGGCYMMERSGMADGAGAKVLSGGGGVDEGSGLAMLPIMRTVSGVSAGKVQEKPQEEQQPQLVFGSRCNFNRERYSAPSLYGAGSGFGSVLSRRATTPMLVSTYMDDGGVSLVSSADESDGSPPNSAGSAGLEETVVLSSPCSRHHHRRNSIAVKFAKRCPQSH